MYTHIGEIPPIVKLPSGEFVNFAHIVRVNEIDRETGKLEVVFVTSENPIGYYGDDAKELLNLLTTTDKINRMPPPLYGR